MACYRIITWEPFMVAAAIRMRFHAAPPVPWELVGEVLRVSGSSVRYKFDKRHRDLCLRIDRQRTEEKRKERLSRDAIFLAEKISEEEIAERIVSDDPPEEIYIQKKKRNLIPYAGSKYDGRI